MDREQITILQLLFLLAAIIISAGHFLFVRIVLIETGHDAWLVIVPAAAIGLAAFYAVIQLLQKNDGLTLIEITLQIFGKWLGRLIIVPYLLFFMAVPIVIIRAVGDFLPSTLPYTPYSVITITLVLLSAVSVWMGIEIIARASQLILPILIAIGLLATLLISKDKHIEYLLPLFQIKLPALMRGILPLAGLFSEVVVAGMLLTSLRSLKHAQRGAVWFFCLIAISFIGPTTGPPMVFGDHLAQKFAYPTYEEIRYIQITNVIERPDVLAIILWGFGTYFKISVFLYALCKGFAQWLGLKEYRPFVVPFAVIMLISSTKFASNRSEVWKFLTDVYPFMALSVGLVLPWITLLIGRFRKDSPHKENMSCDSC